MDKNTVLALVLIALIFIGFNWWSKPSQEEIDRQQHYRDSIAQVEQQRAAIQQFTDTVTQNAQALPAATATADATDSALLNTKFGAFSNAASGEETFYTLENELVKIVLTNKGGRIYSAELKNYKTHDSLPLLLFAGDESAMSFTFATLDNRIINTQDLFFAAAGSTATDSEGNQTLTLRLTTDNGATLDYNYTLPKNDYMLQFALKATDFQKIIAANTNILDLHLQAKIRQQERGHSFENRYAKLSYKLAGNDVTELSPNKNDQKRERSSKIKWIAFQDQFFSTVLIADDWFTDSEMSSTVENEHSPYLKTYEATTTVPFDINGLQPTSFRFYLGPNQYKILTAYDKGKPASEKLYLRRLVPIGWGFFLLQWVNRFAVIPIFNFLSQFISNFGIIILLLTLIVKTLLFPLTYKSYLSGAKMRVLKPEIDEINAKIPADKPQERQKAMMNLYSKVGASPMSGCLPMLIQTPVLVSLFYFFPTAIELRQEHFLWAKDLSSYDSIWNFPFSLPFGFGDHISLFCLLMAAAQIVSTKLTQQTQPMATDQPGMGMMKWMMYLMPVFFMFIFNNYASGLTFYYFVSTLITIIQMYAIRAFIDEKKLLAQLHAKRDSRAKNPTATKKLSFMERLEKMQYEQQKAMKQKGRK